MKYSILMPYYKRALQLQSTLKSFAHFYADRTDYEIIIIEDNKNDSQDKADLKTVLDLFGNLNIKKVHGTIEESFSPATNYNIGAEAASGEFLVLTNPEAMHSVNILEGFDKDFEKSKDIYIVCSCLSVTVKYLPVDKLGEITGKWYQHSNYRNTGCHFCSAITKEQYFKLNGFDEKYSLGIGFDDDDFRNKVKESGIIFQYRDDLRTIHLYHPIASSDKNRHLHNENLYNEKWGKDSFRAKSLAV